MAKTYVQEMIKDLNDLVQIPSIYSDKAFPGAPFGKDVKDCLLKLLSIGNRMGFKVKNYHGYVGEMDMGEGDLVIGVLCHLDVVAPGEGWDTEPFAALVKDGKIYGRGCSDDKGPLIASMYAVKRLKEEHKLPSNVTIRIIVGTNEEEAWEDMKYYVKAAERLPNFSIVPDAMFPLIYCEKGLYDVDLCAPFSSQADSAIRLVELESGAARNMVAAKAHAVLEVGSDFAQEAAAALQAAASCKNYDGKIEVQGRYVAVSMIGKSAHAMNPQKGVNAAVQLIDVLAALEGYDFSHKEFVERFNRTIGSDCSGEKAGFACEDTESGALTFNIGTMSLDKKGAIMMQASIRYPASFPFDAIEASVKQGISKAGFTAALADHMAPIYFKKDDPYIKILLDTYRDVTGDFESAPASIGGATYARAIPSAVAFGPLFPDEEELAHEPNEYISINTLLKAEEIYNKALKALCAQFAEESPRP